MKGKKKNNDHAPFSLEVKITDEKGRKIFHWKPAQNNLTLGMKKTSEFVSCKLGIGNENIKSDDIIEEYWTNESMRKEINKVIKDGFGLKDEKK